MVVGIGKVNFLLGDLETSSIIGHHIFDLIVNLGTPWRRVHVLTSEAQRFLPNSVT